MNKFGKTGILLVTLAIPVFIWLFLKFFGSNSFELPIYYTQGIDSLSDCRSTSQPHQISDFKLTQVNGDSLRLSDLKDHILLSYFLPNTCGADCEFVLEQLANVNTVLRNEENFQILVFANEKYSDEQLGSLQQRYDIASGQLYFLQSNTPAYNDLKKCGFVLSAEQENTLVLTDADQRIRGYYDGTDASEIDRLKGEVKILEYMQEISYHDKNSQ